jgi:hypothetical protein
MLNHVLTEEQQRYRPIKSPSAPSLKHQILFVFSARYIVASPLGYLRLVLDP